MNKDFTENLLSGTVECCNLHDASDVIKLLIVDPAFSLDNTINLFTLTSGCNYSVFGKVEQIYMYKA